MALGCRPVEEGLLMLIHKQLPLGVRLRTLAHLAVCPECRRRRDELARATSALAGAVRGPALPAWRPHVSMFVGREAIVISGTVVALVLMLMSFWHWMGPSLASSGPGTRGNKAPSVWVSGTDIPPEKAGGRAPGTRSPQPSAVGPDSSGPR